MTNKSSDRVRHQHARLCELVLAIDRNRGCGNTTMLVKGAQQVNNGMIIVPSNGNIPYLKSIAARQPGNEFEVKSFESIVSGYGLAGRSGLAITFDNQLIRELMVQLLEVLNQVLPELEQFEAVKSALKTKGI